MGIGRRGERDHSILVKRMSSNESSVIQTNPDTFLELKCLYGEAVVSCSSGGITEYGSRDRHKHEWEDCRRCLWSRCVDCHQDEVKRWKTHYRKAVYLYYGR